MYKVKRRKKMLKTLKIMNNKYIGLFMLATDKFCIVGDMLEDKEIRTIEDALGVDVIKARVAGTSLIGVFAAGNSYGVVLPWIAREEEVNALEDAGIRTIVIKDRVTAMGNLIEANDKGAVVSPLLRPENAEAIGKHLHVHVLRHGVAGIDLPGACTVATNKGFLTHPNASEEELKMLSELFRVKGDTTTANFGDPFIGASIVANSKGVLVGEGTTPVELLKIEDILG